MKYTIKWLLALLTVLNPILSSAALTDFDRQEINFKNWLAPYNSGFESGKAKWTASGGTFTAITSGSNLLVGKGSATWDGSSASQTLTSQTITIEKGYYGRNCEAGIVAQVPSGTATHTVQAYDGTNILVSATIINSTTPRLNTVNFPCPQSGTVALRLVTVASDEPLIAVDDAYLGLARNVGSTQLISEWTSYTPTIGLTGGSTTAYGKYRRIGDSVEVSFDATFTTVFTGGTASVSIPSVCSAIDTAKLPAGYSTGVGLPDSNARLYDVGTGQWGGSIVYNDTTTVLMRVWTDDVGAGGNHVQADAAISTTIPFTWANNDRASGSFRIPCVGWTAQTVVMPDAQGWFAAASITGASASLSTTTQASFTEITNGSLTLTPSSGSALIGIACASGTTNSSGATTCASANESLGVTVSVPTSGAYRVCASASNFLEDTGAATNVNATQTFKINRTSNANSTVITSGDATAYTVLKTNSGGGGEVLGSAYPFSICSVFSLSSGSNTFRLMYSSSIAGTLATNTVDIAGGVSQSAYFRVEPVNSQQQAILANSVSSASTNGTYFNSSQVGSTGTVSKETGDWISGSCSVASAVYTCTLVAGAFSTDPACNATIFGETTNYNAVVTSASTSSVVVRTFDTANTAAAAAFGLTCSGPR